MDSERYQQIKAILFEVEALPADQQIRAVQDACGDDLSLIADVRAFLDGPPTEDFLDKPLFKVAPEEDEALGPPETLGAYRIEQEIGAGGMGTVYLASRDDGTFEQKVAVKVMKRGMDTRELLRRFDRERRLLAGLNHPNIARLFDGGATPDGRPYYVMEYVEGLQVMAHCRTYKLDLNQRLALFGKICNAVVFAHQNLIVHRDIKPENILITASGEPKLLDFGIARLLNSEAQEVTRTAAGTSLMTPRYASPEQVRGEVVTTATDVYALGLLLYEMLTHQPAHNLRENTFSEVVRVVCEQPVERPSSITQSAPAGKLAGDLDNIILNALRKEPERRYQSVRHLADDIDRYRNDFPVHARKEAFTYVAGKFIRRHRLGVTMSMATLLLLVGFLITLGIQLDRAERAQMQAEGISEFLRGVFKNTDPMAWGAGNITARDLLKRSIIDIQEMYLDDPQVRAQMLTVLGSAATSLNMEEARSLLDESLAIQDAQGMTDRTLRAQTLNEWARAHLRDRENPKLDPYLAEAEQIAKDLDDGGELLAWVLNAKAHLQINRKDPEAAIPILETALALLEGEGRVLDTMRAELMDSLSVGHRRIGNLPSQVQWLERSMEMRLKYLPPEHPRMLPLYNNLAAAYKRQDRLDKAEPLVRLCLNINSDIHGQDDLRTILARAGLAGQLFFQKKMEEAEVEIKRVIEQLSPRSDGRENLANMRNMLATLKRDQEKYSEAKVLYQQALDTLEARGGPFRMSIHYNLALLHGRLEEPDAAAREMQKARAIVVEENGEKHPYFARILKGEAVLQRDAGRLSEARASLDKALKIFLATLGDQHPVVAAVYLDQAKIAQEQGLLAQAEAAARNCIGVFGAESKDPNLREGLTLLHGLIKDRDEAEAQELKQRIDQFEANSGTP